MATSSADSRILTARISSLKAWTERIASASKGSTGGRMSTMSGAGTSQRQNMEMRADVLSYQRMPLTLCRHLVIRPFVMSMMNMLSSEVQVIMLGTKRVEEKHNDEISIMLLCPLLIALIAHHLTCPNIITFNKLWLLLAAFVPTLSYRLTRSMLKVPSLGRTRLVCPYCSG